MTASRGGIVSGLAIAIGIILFALLVGCIAIAHDDDKNSFRIQTIAYHECDEQSDCYDGRYDQDYSSQDRNRNRDRNRGAFSPGPFDRSPVDIHDNQVCISPDCSSRDKKEEPPKGKAGFITDPRKIVEFPVTIVEMSLDFAQRIIKLVV
jgi:hypothetical protein